MKEMEQIGLASNFSMLNNMTVDISGDLLLAVLNVVFLSLMLIMLLVGASGEICNAVDRCRRSCRSRSCCPCFGNGGDAQSTTRLIPEAENRSIP